MNITDQLDWERRRAFPAAASAIWAAVLLIASGVYLQVAIEDRPDDTAELLRTVDRQSSDFVTNGVLQGLGLILLTPVLLYLYRVVKYRRPETPTVALVLVLAGPILSGVFAVVRQILLVDVGADFVAGDAIPGLTREDRADQVIDDSSLPIVGGLGFAANLSLGIGVVVLSVGAMRSGVTSRFLGIIGIIIGVLYVIPVAGGPQIVQLFWLGGLAMLFLGRWPGGRGPAWEAGESIPWPTAADRVREQEGRDGDGDDEPGFDDLGPDDEGLPELSRPPSEGNGKGPLAPQPRSRKRKRKKRGR